MVLVTHLSFLCKGRIQPITQNANLPNPHYSPRNFLGSKAKMENQRKGT